MQIAIELPDNIVQQLQHYQNIQQFIQEAIQLKLLQDEKIQEQRIKNKNFLTLLNNITPVKTPHSAIEMLSQLRQHQEE